MALTLKDLESARKQQAAKLDEIAGAKQKAEADIASLIEQREVAADAGDLTEAKVLSAKIASLREDSDFCNAFLTKCMERPTRFSAEEIAAAANAVTAQNDKKIAAAIADFDKAADACISAFFKASELYASAIADISAFAVYAPYDSVPQIDPYCTSMLQSQRLERAHGYNEPKQLEDNRLNISRNFTGDQESKYKAAHSNFCASVKPAREISAGKAILLHGNKFSVISENGDISIVENTEL